MEKGQQEGKNKFIVISAHYGGDKRRIYFVSRCETNFFHGCQSWFNDVIFFKIKWSVTLCFSSSFKAVLVHTQYEPTLSKLKMFLGTRRKFIVCREHHTNNLIFAALSLCLSLEKTRRKISFWAFFQFFPISIFHESLIFHFSLNEKLCNLLNLFAIFSGKIACFFRAKMKISENWF